MPVRETSIHCPRSLRAMWPNPLAPQWRNAYPHLFDDKDLDLTVTQSWTHFFEWFSAIHIYHRDGDYSLVEKYNCLSHGHKRAIYESVMSEQERAILHRVCDANGVQVPDLLIYSPDRSRYRFAEVKGAGDRLSTGQRASHDAIESELGVQVEVIHVLVDEGV